LTDCIRPTKTQAGTGLDKIIFFDYTLSMIDNDDMPQLLKKSKGRALLPSVARCIEHKSKIESATIQKAKKQARKRKAIALLGGKCSRCGGKYSRTPEVFDFHHIDPADKGKGIASILHGKNWQSVEIELKKCVLLCANCHRIAHARGLVLK